LWTPEPWFLWAHAGERPGYILFEGCHLIMIPDSSSAAVHVLDVDGRRLGGATFPTGWRIDIEDASYKVDAALGVPVIEVRTAR